jgi:hypothetical protein
MKMSKQNNYRRDYRHEFVESQAQAPPAAPFSVEQSVDILPAQLESLDYNDLKSGLNYIRNCIQGLTNKSNLQKKYEEQYCYFVRELELRQTKIQ